MPAMLALHCIAQDQALAVGESMTRDQVAASARKSRIALSCCRIMAAAGQLLSALTPSGGWGAAGARGQRGAGVAGPGSGGDEARKLERMNTIQRAASLSYTT